MAAWFILHCHSYSIPPRSNIGKQEHKFGPSAIITCIFDLLLWGKKSLPSQQEFPNE